jgi:hypothetical protein
MIETILAVCLYVTMPTPADMTEYRECRETKYMVYSVEEWLPTIQSYFKDEDVIRAAKVIYCESSGRPTVIGVNKDGTHDVGLWQFNDNTWTWLKSKLGIIGERTNPEVATRYAAWLVYNDGWHHWNSSKKCWKGTNNE